ncbi:MAG: hypothetical protein ABI666_07385 [Ferruginibacter sp.]
MKVAILILFVLFSVNAFTQSNEYIVKNNGDTVTGEVKILAKQIKVIRTPADTVILNSEDVRLFVRKNTAKIVLRLILYGYTDNIDEIQSTSYRNPVYDTTILLTSIISGEKLNLFSGKDKRKVVYFFVQRQEDAAPIQLLYSIGGDMPEKASWGHPYQYVNYITHHRIFESQLRDMTSDCEYITEGYLKMLDYRFESSLKKFIVRYNKKCK